MIDILIIIIIIILSGTVTRIWQQGKISVKISVIAYVHDKLFHHDGCAGLKNNFHQST